MNSIAEDTKMVNLGRWTLMEAFINQAVKHDCSVIKKKEKYYFGNAPKASCPNISVDYRDHVYFNGIHGAEVKIGQEGRINIKKLGLLYARFKEEISGGLKGAILGVLEGK
ncbi:MAG: hypothetical protein ACJAY8_000181 [Sphingobacteriales bacterium]